MTDIKELSEYRQQEYHTMLQRLGRTEEWGQVALNINPAEKWEQYGFGAFKLDWLQKRVQYEMDSKQLYSNDYIERISKLEDSINNIETSLNNLVDYLTYLNERIIKLEKVNDNI